MKKIIYYVVLMIAVLLIMPLLIVKSCGYSTQEPPEPPKDTKQLTINVYVSTEKKVKRMLLEEYVKGVVAAEMPAAFGLEALKAQAVAARTYAYGRMIRDSGEKAQFHAGGDVCTDFAHCQAWVSKKDAMSKWGFFDRVKYWSKIEQAVKETESIVITYNGQIINPVFHSNSGGRTENSEDVWAGGPVPYLKSVVSNGEEDNKEYKNEALIGKKNFYQTLKEQFPDLMLNQKTMLKEIKILDYTAGGRVKTLKIGNISMAGTEFRKLFSLKSANFKITEKDAGTLKITTLGNGHGVGMSQWGANYLSTSGGSYKEILKYYYQGIELKKLRIKG